MLGGRNWLRAAAMLVAFCAASVGASQSPKAPAAWKADPDDQFLLDVHIRQLRLGDGVRAYNTPEGTCVVLGDFITTLDVPMKVDFTARKASGWAFKETNKITIDEGAMTATYGAKSESIAPGTIRETPEGWCVQTTALSRWFGIGVKPVTAGSVLILQSDTKLPVELAMERQARAAQIHPAKFDLASLPQVRIPYRMWRTPALDFVVSAGVTYQPGKVVVDRQASIYAAGEIADLSYDAQVTTNQNGVPSAIRVRAYRSDPDGHLLGPLQATHFAVGDVEGFDSSLTGTSAYGRGAVITNRPLSTQAAFDTTRFEGDLPVGWEAELYRNDELLGFAKPTSDQRYVFDNVQLLYGDNRIRIVLYGPQGQVRTREETINVGQDNVPPGKTWYWVGFNQPSHDLFTPEKPPDGQNLPTAQATVALEHGIDDRTSVAALAREMLIDDQRMTFVEGSIRRSVGMAMIEIGAARESNGGTAERAQILGQIGTVNVDAQALIANDFHLNGGALQSIRDYSLSLDAPLRLGRTVLPAHAEVHLTDRADGTRELDAAARLSIDFDRFNLATDVHYQKQFLAGSTAAPPVTSLDFIGSGHIGPVRVRGITTFDVSPAARLRSGEIEAYWSTGQNVDWDADLIYQTDANRANARLSYIRRFRGFAVALTGEAATDGSFAFGLNLNFSLDPDRGFAMSEKPLAQAGEVNALVYRDLNGNGVRDPGEPLEQGAIVTTGTRQSDKTTDSRGTVLIGGLVPFQPIAVGVDVSSLADPMLVPKKALQVVVPRPGVPANVEIGLVGGGDVEGALVKSGDLGFEGVNIELVDANGKVVGTSLTDFDGFFLFERVAYGTYTIRVAKDSATAAKIAEDLNTHFAITPDKAIVRLGTIRAVPQAHLAEAGSAPLRPSLH